MRITASFLILLICISGKAQSLTCDGAFSKVFQATGAAVSEVPYISTFFSLFNFIIGEAIGCVDQSRSIAIEEDRKQEYRQSASTLKAHILTLKEIRSYSDVKNNFWKYDSLRVNMRRERLRYFDPFEHHHESKFKMFTKWGNIELALIDIMIKANHESETAILKEVYGDTLLYYIQKGSEMFSRFPLELAHSGLQNGTRAVRVAEQAGEDLRPSLIEWIEAVETKTEVRKRLSHKGLNSQPSDDPSQWDRLGLDKKYLPLKISDGDWIAMKAPFFGPSSWLSCYNSISNEDYCGLRKCPNVAGNQDANECNSEKFQIQSTAHGPIKFESKIALKYWDWDCSGRGEGTYWLSTYYGKHLLYLYTMPCVGSTFNKHDISRCGSEVFTIEQGYISISSTISSILSLFAGQELGKEGKDNYLRNGDFVHIPEMSLNVFKVGDKDRFFMMKQFRQTGDKNSC